MGSSAGAWASCLLTLIVLSSSVAEESLELEVRRLIREGRAKAAVELIEQHLPPDARRADDWFLLAEAYHARMDETGMLKQRGLAKKMKLALESALALDPAHVDAHRELADFYRYAPWIVGGNEGKARLQIEILERIDPGAAWATRGAHARDAGDLHAARGHYRKAITVGPREPQRLFLLAVIEQQLDEYTASIGLLEEVIAADPDHERAYYYRARASALTGTDLARGLECSLRYLDQCSQCDDSDRSYGWWRRATILKRQGDTSAAIKAYREALRLNPELKGARKGLEELER